MAFMIVSIFLIIPSSIRPVYSIRSSQAFLLCCEYMKSIIFKSLLITDSNELLSINH